MPYLCSYGNTFRFVTSYLMHVWIYVYLCPRNEALRVAFIDEVETLKDGKVHKEFYSKLVKADVNGKDMVSFLLCCVLR